jgi:hypothetical protein
MVMNGKIALHLCSSYLEFEMSCNSDWFMLYIRGLE